MGPNAVPCCFSEEELDMKFFSMKVPSRVFALALVSSLAVSAMGCAALQVDDESTTDEAAAESSEAAFKGRARGPFGLFAEAERSLELDAARKAKLAAITQALRPDGDRKDAGREEAQAALAAAVRSGNFDAVALGKDAPSHEAMHKAMTEKLGKALTDLHELLTAEERAKLVARVRENGDKEWPSRDREGRGRERAHHGQDDAEDAGPEREKGKFEGGRAPKGAHGAMGKGGPLGFMLRDLELDEAQKSKIDAILEADRPKDSERPSKEDHETWIAEHKAAEAALLDGFASANFDAAALLAKNAPPMKKGHSKEKMVETLSQVVSVLTPAQRETLAKNLEAGPPPGGPRGHRGHGDRERHVEE